MICHCVSGLSGTSSPHKKDGTAAAEVRETSANSYLHSCGELLRILGTYNKRLEGTLSSSIHRWATHSTTERKHYSSYTLEKVCVITNVTSCFGKVVIVIIHLNLYDFWRRSLLHGVISSKLISKVDISKAYIDFCTGTLQLIFLWYVMVIFCYIYVILWI